MAKNLAELAVNDKKCVENWIFIFPVVSRLFDEFLLKFVGFGSFKLNGLIEIGSDNKLLINFFKNANIVTIHFPF